MLHVLVQNTPEPFAFALPAALARLQRGAVAAARVPPTSPT